MRTYEGSKMWRRRHYRVRRAEVPGTFRFSVLDNGVTSNEFWRSGSTASSTPVPCCVLTCQASGSAAGLPSSDIEVLSVFKVSLKSTGCPPSI